jgi:hypothetical protein
MPHDETMMIRGRVTSPYRATGRDSGCARLEAVEPRNGMPEPGGYDAARTAEKARDARVAGQLARIGALAACNVWRDHYRACGQCHGGGEYCDRGQAYRDRAFTAAVAEATF